MRIIKTSAYKRSYKKNIVNKHLTKEIKRIENIEELINASENLQSLINNPFYKVYNITRKKGDLSEIYTAKINDKLRLKMRPVGEMPYNIFEITEIEFLEVDDKHYGEG